jgi:hypothetical protein
MGKYGAKLMRRSKQRRQAVDDGWNEVEDFEKLQEEANGGFGGVEEDQEDNFGKI